MGRQQKGEGEMEIPGQLFVNKLNVETSEFTSFVKSNLIKVEGAHQSKKGIEAVLTEGVEKQPFFVLFLQLLLLRVCCARYILVNLDGSAICASAMMVASFCRRGTFGEEEEEEEEEVSMQNPDLKFDRA